MCIIIYPFPLQGHSCFFIMTAFSPQPSLNLLQQLFCIKLIVYVKSNVSHYQLFMQKGKGLYLTTEVILLL